MQPGAIDAGLFHAALSFVPLTRQGAVVDFCSGLLAMRTTSVRTELKELTCKLLTGAFDAHPTWSFTGYAPVPMTVPARYAAFSANLTLLAVLAAGTKLSLDEILGHEGVNKWRRNALFWQSQLSNKDWGSLWRTLRVTVTCYEGSLEYAEEVRYEIIEDFWVQLEDGSAISLWDVHPTYEMIDDYDGGVSHGSSSIFGNLEAAAQSFPGRVLRESSFRRDGGFFFQALQSQVPFWRYGTVGHNWLRHRGVAAPIERALVELRLSSPADMPRVKRIALYCIILEGLKKTPIGPEQPHVWLNVVFRQLKEDIRCFTTDDVVTILLDFRGYAASVSQARRRVWISAGVGAWG